MKVAIVCDWLTGIGGAERVVLELHKMFPEAPIYTSQYDPERIPWFKDADVRTLWLQKLPRGLKKFLPVLRAWSFSRLNLSGYDLVISSSGAEAKGISVSKNTLHVNYCHAPTHYYWSRYEDYLKNPGFGSFDWLARIGLKLLVYPMRRWDYKAAQKPSYLIANSNHTRQKIKKYYGRDSVVIHPPVDTVRFKATSKIERKGFVVTGRQTPYKRIDLAVAACTALNLPLNVIGSGPENKKLRKMAGPTVTFLGQIPDSELPKYFHSAEAFIFPALDDFGIVSVEAMAAGTPVIAYKAGGALDYVNEKTGIFFDEQTPESLMITLEKFQSQDFDHHVIQTQAESFNLQNFRQKIEDYITSLRK